MGAFNKTVWEIDVLGHSPPIFFFRGETCTALSSGDYSLVVETHFSVYLRKTTTTTLTFHGHTGGVITRASLLLVDFPMRCALNCTSNYLNVVAESDEMMHTTKTKTQTQQTLATQTLNFFSLWGPLRGGAPPAPAESSAPAVARRMSLLSYFPRPAPRPWRALWVQGFFFRVAFERNNVCSDVRTDMTAVVVLSTNHEGRACWI